MQFKDGSAAHSNMVFSGEQALCDSYFPEGFHLDEYQVKFFCPLSTSKSKES